MSGGTCLWLVYVPKYQRLKNAINCFYKEPVAKEPVYWNDFTLWDTATRYSRCWQKLYSIFFLFHSIKSFQYKIFIQTACFSNYSHYTNLYDKKRRKNYQKSFFVLLAQFHRTSLQKTGPKQIPHQIQNPDLINKFYFDLGPKGYLDRIDPIIGSMGLGGGVYLH